MVAAMRGWAVRCWCERMVALGNTAAGSAETLSSLFDGCCASEALRHASDLVDRCVDAPGRLCEVLRIATLRISVRLALIHALLNMGHVATSVPLQDLLLAVLQSVSAPATAPDATLSELQQAVRACKIDDFLAADSGAGAALLTLLEGKAETTCDPVRVEDGIQFAPTDEYESGVDRIREREHRRTDPTRPHPLPSCSYPISIYPIPSPPISSNPTPFHPILSHPIPCLPPGERVHHRTSASRASSTPELKIDNLLFALESSEALYERQAATSSTDLAVACTAVCAHAWHRPKSQHAEARAIGRSFAADSGAPDNQFGHSKKLRLCAPACLLGEATSQSLLPGLTDLTTDY